MNDVATDAIVEMPLEECWEHLADAGFGRLAFSIIDEVHIVPVNFAVDGRSLLVRTAEGNKLFAAALGAPVAMEIDWHGDGAAWSVVARGHLRKLEESEEHRADDAGLTPWVPTLKYDVVEVVTETVSGRRFDLRSDGGVAG